MWDCLACGCKAIIHDLPYCPACRKKKGKTMPKTTTGGSTNAWEGLPESDPAEQAPEQVEGDADAPSEEAEAVAPPKRPKAAKPVSEPPAVTGSGGIKIKAPGAQS
jgi:hypothetical protein